MGYTVMLAFDTESEKKILDMWKDIRDKGVNSFMLDTDSKPHIAIAVQEYSIIIYQTNGFRIAK